MTAIFNVLTFARLLKMTAKSEETCKTLTQKCLDEFIKDKKSDHRAQVFFVEDYVHNAFVTLCSSRKYPYSPHRRDWNFLGGGGSIRPKPFKERYET